MKYKGFKKTNGEIVSTAYLDGYSFGDRLMEGVSYGIRVNANGELEAFIPKSSADYMDDFNCEKWLGIAKSYAEDTDIFFEKENLSGDELELIPIGKRKPRPVPVAINMTPFNDVLKDLGLK